MLKCLSFLKGFVSWLCLLVVFVFVVWISLSFYQPSPIFFSKIKGILIYKFQKKPFIIRFIILQDPFKIRIIVFNGIIFCCFTLPKIHEKEKCLEFLSWKYLFSHLGFLRKDQLSCLPIKKLYPIDCKLMLKWEEFVHPNKIKMKIELLYFYQNIYIHLKQDQL